MAARTRGTPDPIPDPNDDQDLDLDQDQDIVGRPRRRKGPVVFIIFAILLVGGLTAILGFNVLNIRDQYIFPPLRGLPLVGEFIPGAEYIYINGEYIEIPVDVAELEATIHDLAEQLATANAALAQAQSINEQQADTVVALQVYRDFITEYRENRRQFDEMVVMGDPNAFAAFFERVEPDMQARLYAQIRAQRVVDREFRTYARTYTEMSTDEAAAVFTLLLAQNPGLLLRILDSFTTAQRAEVFNEMEAQDVAVITILMEPDMDTAGILPPVPVIGGGSTPNIPIITVGDTPAED